MEQFKATSNTLCLVFAIFRHGQRTPVIFASTDPNKNKWQNRLGYLTNKGKRQAHDTGIFLRKKYGHLISETYSGDEIYVRSTDVDRTLMTAQCCLAGLYPPKGDDIWNDDLMWQPIPVHTVTYHSDPLAIKFSEKLEPPDGGYPHKRQQLNYDIISQNKELLKMITEDNKEDLGKGLKILNTMEVEAEFNVPVYIPKGVDMGTASLLKNSIYQLHCETSKHSVASAVYLLSDILLKMQMKAAGKIPRQKAYIYSVHDINITGCLAAFTKGHSCSTELFPEKILEWPDYSATLLFEVHKGVNDFYIETIYHRSCPLQNNDVGSFLIPLQTFQKVVNNFTDNSKIWKT